MTDDVKPRDIIRPSHINRITPDDGEVIVGGETGPVRRPLSDFDNSAVLAQVDMDLSAKADISTVDALATEVAGFPAQVDTLATQVATKADVASVTAVETAVSRIDPGANGNLGQTLSHGPTGPTWKRDAVSADWYSNINDAITAAGQGGVVRFSAGVSYAQASTIRLIPGISLIGDNTEKVSITVTDATGIAVSNPTVMHAGVRLSGFRLFGAGGALVGADLRGCTRLVWDTVDVFQGFANVALWLGGDYPAYHSGWSNELHGGQIVSPLNGAGILFSGTTTTGSATANAMSLRRLAVFVQNADTSIGVDLRSGDSNLIEHCDVGYSNGADGIPFRLGALGGKASYNTLISNRTEAVGRSMLIESGGYGTTCVGNVFASTNPAKSPIEIKSPAEFNTFIGNTYLAQSATPKVKVNAGALFTRVMDASTDTDKRATNVEVGTSGTSIMVGRVSGDATNRFSINAGGGLIWTDPATGAIQNHLRQSSGPGRILGLSDSEYWQLPRHTALPPASATRRGSMIRVEGATGVADGTYVCRKKADDTYEWVNLTP